MLKPALLYGDHTTVIAAESDYASEMLDYLAFEDAVSDSLDLLFLDLAYGVTQAGETTREPTELRTGRPCVPAAFDDEAAAYAKEAAAALQRNDRSYAVAATAQILLLGDGTSHAYDGTPALIEAVGGGGPTLLDEARMMLREHQDIDELYEAMNARLLLATYLILSSAPGSYGLLDDASGALARASASPIFRTTKWLGVRAFARAMVV